MRLALAIVLVVSSHAAAQTAIVVTSASDEAAGERWRAWLAERSGEIVTPEAAVEAAEPVASFDPSRLEVLTEIEELILRARSLTARLREGEALRFLAGAERLAASILDVPGAAAWYVEAQLAIALTATQAELPDLAAAALARAASVDPSRPVLAGEAHPDLVEQSRASIRASITAPRGSFELATTTPGAVVYLDDRELGPLPRRIEAPVGPHILRIEAPGRSTWARVTEVLEGARARIEVSLPPSARARAASELEDHAAEGRLEHVEEGLRALGPIAPRTIVLWASRDRAVAVACSPACGPARMLSSQEPVEHLEAAPTGSLSEALAWLGASATPRTGPAPGEWWEQWWVWAVAGAVVAAGTVATAAAAAQPTGEPARVFTFYPP